MDGCATAEGTTFRSKSVLCCSWHLLMPLRQCQHIPVMLFHVSHGSLFIYLRMPTSTQDQSPPPHYCMAHKLIKICLPIKSLTLLIFHKQNTSDMLSFSSAHMPIFPERAIKWKGWLPLLILCTAGGTHKPHPKHSQETHKDPTEQDNPALTTVN